MKYALSRKGILSLEQSFAGSDLIAFDFDGTLAPIVNSPKEAIMGKTTASLLSQLNEIADVVIISGRALDDLRSRIPLAVRTLVGNHGLEDSSFKNAKNKELRAICRDWRRQIRAIPAPSSVARLDVEDKGCSLALHYRNSPNKTAALRFINQILVELTPSPRVISGKCVVNLMPTFERHKGVALLELIARKKLRSAIYVGDDDTDEDVFSLSKRGIKLISIRVGQKRKGSKATFFIKRQAEINKLIRSILKARGAFRQTS